MSLHTGTGIPRPHTPRSYQFLTDAVTWQRLAWVRVSSAERMYLINNNSANSYQYLWPWPKFWVQILLLSNTEDIKNTEIKSLKIKVILVSVTIWHVLHQQHSIPCDFSNPFDKVITMFVQVIKHYCNNHVNNPQSACAVRVTVVVMYVCVVCLSMIILMLHVTTGLLSDTNSISATGANPSISSVYAYSSCCLPLGQSCPMEASEVVAEGVTQWLKCLQPQPSVTSVSNRRRKAPCPSPW